MHQILVLKAAGPHPRGYSRLRFARRWLVATARSATTLSSDSRLTPPDYGLTPPGYRLLPAASSAGRDDDVERAVHRFPVGGERADVGILARVGRGLELERYRLARLEQL